MLRARVREQEQMIEALRRQVAEQDRLLRALQEEVRALRHRLVDSAHDARRSDARSSTVSAAERTTTSTSSLLWSRGRPILQSADGDFALSLSGEGQLDFRAYSEGTLANTFVVRRLRVAIAGRLTPRYEYRLQADLADRGTGVLRDGWLRIHLRPGWHVQVGQFKEPFSQEELRSAMHIDFVERAMTTQIAPSRSPGLQLSGEIARGRIAFQVGAFNGKGALTANTSRVPEGVLRLRLSPMMGSHMLRVGGAVAVGRARGGMSLAGQTESRSALFFAARPVNGSIVRANGELTYLKGPLALRAEYNQMAQDRERLGPQGTHLPAVIAKGYAAQLTYLLTGEARPEEGPVVLTRPVGGSAGGWGAWEVKARYSMLQLSDGLQTARAETITCGVNWYLTPFVKIMLDLAVEDLPPSLPLSRAHPLSVLTRVQFAF